MPDDPQQCEHADPTLPGACGGPLERVRPMTAYGDEPDFLVLCQQCAQSYREFWNEMWDEYYTGRL